MLYKLNGSSASTPRILSGASLAQLVTRMTAPQRGPGRRNPRRQDRHPKPDGQGGGGDHRRQPELSVHCTALYAGTASSSRRWRSSADPAARATGSSKDRLELGVCITRQHPARSREVDRGLPADRHHAHGRERELDTTSAPAPMPAPFSWRNDEHRTRHPRHAQCF
jgi:hypothetical protein